MSEDKPERPRPPIEAMAEPGSAMENVLASKSLAAKVFATQQAATDIFTKRFAPVDALGESRLALKRIEDQQSAIQRFLEPGGAVRDLMDSHVMEGYKRTTAPPTNFSPSDEVMESVREGVRAGRQEQARLVVEPLVAKFDAQHRVLEKVSEVMVEQTDLLREQTTELAAERRRRELAESGQANAVRHDRLKNTALVVLTLLLVLMTAALVYLALNPPNQ